MARVLVIIPAYNERETIRAVIASLREHAPEYDIVVVDDGSTDETTEIVRSLGVPVLRLPFNLGIGGAVQTGYQYALREGYDVAVQCDADGQHPVHQMRRLVERIEDGSGNLVIGSRFVTDTEYSPSMARRVGKSLLSRLVDSVTGLGITDTTSGFRAADRKVIAVFAESYPEDYPESETIVIAHKHGLKTIEVPVDMQPRQGGSSSIGPRRAAYYIIKVSLAIFVNVFKRFTGGPGGVARNKSQNDGHKNGLEPRVCKR